MVLDQEDLKQIDNFGLRLLASNLPLWSAELERMRWSSPGGKFCNPLTLLHCPLPFPQNRIYLTVVQLREKSISHHGKSDGVPVQKILKSGCERTDQVMFSKRMPQTDKYLWNQPQIYYLLIKSMSSRLQKWEWHEQPGDVLGFPRLFCPFHPQEWHAKSPVKHFPVLGPIIMPLVQQGKLLAEGSPSKHQHPELLAFNRLQSTGSVEVTKSNWFKICRNHTVDGRNPAPVVELGTLSHYLLTRFYTSQVFLPSTVWNHELWPFQPLLNRYLQHLFLLHCFLGPGKWNVGSANRTKT